MHLFKLEAASAMVCGRVERIPQDERVKRVRAQWVQTSGRKPLLFVRMLAAPTAPNRAALHTGVLTYPRVTDMPVVRGSNSFPKNLSNRSSSCPSTGEGGTKAGAWACGSVAAAAVAAAAAAALSPASPAPEAPESAPFPLRTVESAGNAALAVLGPPAAVATATAPPSGITGALAVRFRAVPLPAAVAC